MRRDTNRGGSKEATDTNKRTDGGHERKHHLEGKEDGNGDRVTETIRHAVVHVDVDEERPLR